jgi:hypothetical protein
MAVAFGIKSSGQYERKKSLGFLFVSVLSSCQPQRFTLISIWHSFSKIYDDDYDGNVHFIPVVFVVFVVAVTFERKK